MPKDQYFRPCNWGEHQAVKRRGADYIRNKTHLLNSTRYRSLTCNQRAVLHGIWMLCGDTGRALPLDSSFTGARLGLTSQVTGHALKHLLDCNYLEICSQTDGLVQQAPLKGEGEGEVKGEKKESRGAKAPDNEVYSFVGNTIRLKAKDFDKWSSAFPRINLLAELQVADDYYTTEDPITDGKWFFRVSSWLKRANNKATDPEAEDPAWAGVL